MNRSLATRSSLLIRLQDADDHRAWDSFFRAYAPLIGSYGRRRGLGEADAEDLVQEALGAVASAMGRLAYDRSRGSFRGWLLTIARNAIPRLRRQAARHGGGEGGTAHQAMLAQHPARPESDHLDLEQGRRRLDRAVERVRPRVRPATWEAFRRTAIERQPVEAVAEDLGLSPGAVYIARSRVLARLREAIASEAEETR